MIGVALALFALGVLLGAAVDRATRPLDRVRVEVVVQPAPPPSPEAARPRPRLRLIEGGAHPARHRTPVLRLVSLEDEC